MPSTDADRAAARWVLDRRHQPYLAEPPTQLAWWFERALASYRAAIFSTGSGFKTYLEARAREVLGYGCPFDQHWRAVREAEGVYREGGPPQLTFIIRAPLVQRLRRVTSCPSQWLVTRYSWAGLLAQAKR